MEKIAQMKYGEDTNEMVLYDFDKLGQAVAIFDLLKVKHGNPIPIGNAIRQSCSAKGAVFILYNVARVQRVLNTFNEKVAIGYYAPLPELDQIDVSLLREEVGNVIKSEPTAIYASMFLNNFISFDCVGGMAAAVRVHIGLSPIVAALCAPNRMWSGGHSFAMHLPNRIYIVVQRVLSSRQNIDCKPFIRLNDLSSGRLTLYHTNILIYRAIKYS